MIVDMAVSRSCLLDDNMITLYSIVRVYYRYGGFSILTPKLYTKLYSTRITFRSTKCSALPLVGVVRASYSQFLVVLRWAAARRAVEGQLRVHRVD